MEYGYKAIAGNENYDMAVCGPFFEYTEPGNIHTCRGFAHAWCFFRRNQDGKKYDMPQPVMVSATYFV